eukprot:2550405-Ditylum_brightwellii.AAC.1
MKANLQQKQNLDSYGDMSTDIGDNIAILQHISVNVSMEEWDDWMKDTSELPTIFFKLTEE